MENPSIPTNWIKRLLEIENLAELKTVLYLICQPDNNEFKRITLDEFASGAKLSRQSIIAGLTNAIEHGLIDCHVDDSNRSNIKKHYKLNMAAPQEREQTTSNPAKNQPRKRKARSTRTAKSRIKAKQPTRPRYQMDTHVLELRSVPYTDYLQSPEWRAKREKALRFAGYRCQLCNSPKNLQVHHRTYERLGNERLSDLTVLCADCHDTFTYNGTLQETPAVNTQDIRKEKEEYESIWTIIAEISKELGDEGHIPSNRMQACNIYDTSGMEEETFLKMISSAKEKAEQANIRKTNSRGEINRMPYFFQCLRRDCL